MSIRLSFGSRWIEIYLFSGLMLGAMDYLFIQCGHNSTRNIIRWMRHHDGRVTLKLGRKKTKVLGKAA
jgi:hypothetical protein